jgi:hypothetical protein
MDSVSATGFLLVQLKIEFRNLRRRKEKREGQAQG